MKSNYPNCKCNICVIIEAHRGDDWVTQLSNEKESVAVMATSSCAAGAFDANGSPAQAEGDYMIQQGNQDHEYDWESDITLTTN
jgi:hypothetical protein